MSDIQTGLLHGDGFVIHTFQPPYRPKTKDEALCDVLNDRTISVGQYFACDVPSDVAVLLVDRALNYVREKTIERCWKCGVPALTSACNACVGQVLAQRINLSR